MSILPAWQPIRPDGNYRTHIKAPSDKYIPWTPRNIIVQIQLYRWCHSMDFQNQTIIADLHGFLFFNFPRVTKRDLGMAMVQATRYNPRKLKGETLNNPKPCSTYMIHNVDDLRYGLEWMICTWLHKAKGTKDSSAISNFLIDMATCDEKDIGPMYLDLLGPWWGQLTEQTLSWSWIKAWNDCEYENETEMAGPKAANRPALTSL